MTTRLFPLATVALLLLAAVGCASSQPAKTPMRATTSPSGVAGVLVPVELDEYAIRMPSRIPRGDVTFDVKNVGHHTHTLALHGNGVDASLPEHLGAGEAGTLAVHLEPGKYKVTCPIGPHALLGMKRTLTVEK